MMLNSPVLVLIRGGRPIKSVVIAKTLIKRAKGKAISIGAPMFVNKNT